MPALVTPNGMYGTPTYERGDRMGDGLAVNLRETLGLPVTCAKFQT